MCMRTSYGSTAQFVMNSISFAKVDPPLAIVRFLIWYFSFAYWYRYVPALPQAQLAVVKDLIILLAFLLLACWFFLYGAQLHTHPLRLRTVLSLLLLVIGIGLFRQPLLNVGVGIRNYGFMFLLPFGYLLSRHRRKRDVVLTTMLYAMVLSSAFGVLLYFSPVDSYLIWARESLSSDRNLAGVGNPTSAALVAIWAVLLLWYLKPRMSFAAKGAVTALCILSLLTTRSITGFGITVVVFALYAIFYRKFGALLTLAAFAALGVASQVHRLREIVSLTDDSLNERLRVWSNLWGRLTGDGSLAYGLGIGTVANTFSPTAVGIVDNSYLTLIGQFGLVGFSVFMLVAFGWFVRSLRISGVATCIFASFAIAMASGNYLEMGFPMDHLFLLLLIALVDKPRDQPAQMAQATVAVQ